MHFHCRNVNEAFERIVSAVHHEAVSVVRSPSRNGDVLKIEEPVIVTYSHPCERVLFNMRRDANPFFHLFESLWMLSGSNLVEPLAFYNSNISRYSDDSKTFHGDYGWRWRSNHDRLRRIAEALQKNPNCRRQVLAIWSAKHDLGATSADIPCNTQAYFSMRKEEITTTANKVFRTHKSVLDMTVCNRSNDLVWGMLGANVVHFSFLLEYMAALIGVGVGRYHQITNNLYTCIDKWEPNYWLDSPKQEYNPTWKHQPLVSNPYVFDMECIQFVKSIDGEFTEPFLRDVAQPMCAAYRAHKQRRYYGDNNAMRILEKVHATDWKEAGMAWVEKRQRKWEAKSRQKQDKPEQANG